MYPDAQRIFGDATHIYGFDTNDEKAVILLNLQLLFYPHLISKPNKNNQRAG